MGRYLNVHDHTLMIDDDNIAIELIERGVLYPCGDDEYNHDLHLNPEHKFTLKDVEDLMQNILHK